MTKHIITILLFASTLVACGQSKKESGINGLIIDPDIRTEAKKHLESSKELQGYNGPLQLFINSGDIESYQNDSLIVRSTFGENKAPFKSFYLWRGDTLNVDGAYGLFGGIGFNIKIYKDSAKLYHMLSSDDFPSYAYNENDSLIYRLEVPCTDTKIVLSEIPDSTKKQTIYGYVEFKSKYYFATNGTVNDREVLPRMRMRNNMKLYFKSGMLSL